MSQKPLIFIIAGEASGDQLGAELMADLKQQGIRFEGIGGEAMAAQGLNTLFPMKELSIMGVTGILRDLPNLLGRLRYTVETIQKLNPDVVITIDAPEFSLRVMKRLHKKVKRPYLIHYVAPSVWAWRPWLAKSVSRFLDGLFCLYPFEPPFFEKYGLKTTFVGHPVARETLPQGHVKRDKNLLCVLPGSRTSEVRFLLPIFEETVARLKIEIPSLKVIVPTVPAVESLVRQGVKDWPVEVEVVLGDKARIKAFQKAYAALAASGTVALQLASNGLPFVIAYKVGKLNEWGGRLLIKTPWACMINILLSFHKFGFLKKDEKSWVSEFIQQNCTADNLTPAMVKLLKDEEARSLQIEAMKEAVSLLKAPKGIAAKTVLDQLVLPL